MAYEHDSYDSRRLRRGADAGRRFPWALFIVFLIVAVLVGRPDRWLERVFAPAATPRAVTPRGNLGSDEQAQIEIFEAASPSVVFVTNLGVRRDFWSRNVFKIPQGTGSGFVWDERGHIVTNLHVLAGAQSVEVTLADGSRHQAEVVGASPDEDLAVLRVGPGAGALEPIAIGTSADLRVGQKVYAIGNPFGLDHTMTSGIVSALGREIEAANGRVIQDAIQTDAAINPGNSGGPLLDSAGRLIGVNTAIYSTTGSYAGIGFAVPVDTVNRVVPQLIQHGKKIRPTLGVQLVPDHLAARLGVASGVLVERVVPGGGAEKAGLRGTARARDRLVLGDVILAVGAKPVKDIDDLLGALEALKPGDAVKLWILRDGERVEVEVTLGQPG